MLVKKHKIILIDRIGCKLQGSLITVHGRVLTSNIVELTNCHRNYFLPYAASIATALVVGTCSMSFIIIFDNFTKFCNDQSRKQKIAHANMIAIIHNVKQITDNTDIYSSNRNDDDNRRAALFCSMQSGRVEREWTVEQHNSHKSDQSYVRVCGMCSSLFSDSGFKRLHECAELISAHWSPANYCQRLFWLSSSVASSTSFCLFQLLILIAMKSLKSSVMPIRRVSTTNQQQKESTLSMRMGKKCRLDLSLSTLLNVEICSNCWQGELSAADMYESRAPTVSRNKMCHVNKIEQSYERVNW